MRIHYLQHVPFEDLANIEPWALSKDFTITRTQLFQNETLPDFDVFDWLIIMGGPMNIYEQDRYRWLTLERQFIQKAIKAEKIVLGICLGAQLIADVLGAKVALGENKEIGWFPIRLTDEAKSSKLFAGFPSEAMAFHWHGDTFSIPQGAVAIANSEAYPNQAFTYQNHVLGLQFHLESSLSSIQKLIENCSDEMIEAKYIQTQEAILAGEVHLPEMTHLMQILLENMSTFYVPSE